MVIWGSSRSKSGFATEKSEYSTSAAKFRVKTSLFKEKNVKHKRVFITIFCRTCNVFKYERNVYFPNCILEIFIQRHLLLFV